MSKKVILMILLVSVAINLATVITFVYFWSTEHRNGKSISRLPPEQFPEWHRSPLVKELGLTDQQLDKIDKVNVEIREVMQPVRNKLLRKRHELMLLLQETQPNQEDAKTCIQEIAALQAEHDTHLFSALLRIRQILTDEQREKLGSMLNALLEYDRPPLLPFEQPPPHHPGEPRPPQQPLPRRGN